MKQTCSIKLALGEKQQKNFVCAYCVSTSSSFLCLKENKKKNKILILKGKKGKD